MRRSQAHARKSGCPIHIALALVGDPWTLLVVRDLMFKGARSFNDLLAGGEGIATNVLSDRLARLEESGMLEKEADPADARRFIYRLTAKGMGLAPVLVELILWSTAHEQTDAPPAVVKRMRADREAFLAPVRAAWRASRRRS
jgi:DNA-binding HxlR family transcriptional regulator